MALLKHFDPPAFLNDFDDIPGQRQAWHEFVSASFDASIASERSLVTTNEGSAPGQVQFFNPTTYDPGALVIEQEVTWNAFPKELLRAFGRARALVEADYLWPLSGYRGHYDPELPEATTPPAPNDVFYRPQVEYCEWHVSRDARTGNIVRVTFTSEPPEYWMALFGGNVEGVGVIFPGSKKRLVELYQELVDPSVAIEDLLVQKPFSGAQGETYDVGDYNPYNKWNTTHGIAHLCAPPNALTAEIQLGADATVLYRDGAGRPLTQADALICGAAYGGPNRNSDPTIGSTVNALARLGAMITLPNPVGLYMDHIDTNGWALPDGISPGDCVRVVRGSAKMIERLVVEVPPETGRTLSEMTIAGVPLRHGGQIAECITVKLVGGAALVNVKGNDLLEAATRGLISKDAPREIYRFSALGAPLPQGLEPAFAQYDRRSKGTAIAVSTRSTAKSHAFPTPRRHRRGL